MKKILTVSQFAELAQVSRDTVERMIKQGKIKATKKNPLAGRTSPFFIPFDEWTRWEKLVNVTTKK